MDESTLRVCLCVGCGGGRRSMAILLLYILYIRTLCNYSQRARFPTHSLFFYFSLFLFIGMGRIHKEKSHGRIKGRGNACDDETDVLSFSSILFLLLVAPGGPFFLFRTNGMPTPLISVRYQLHTSFSFLKKNSRETLSSSMSLFSLERKLVTAF